MVRKTDLLDSLVPITQFNRGQASRIFDRLHNERQLVVLKNNQPAAIILSPEEYSRFTTLEENYALLLEATERIQRNNKPSTTLKDVMKELGISETDLDTVGDVEID